MTNDNANHRRRRGVWLGLLVVLLLALAGVGYALSPSPSAPTSSKEKSSASTSSKVLAPSTGQTTSPGSTTQVALAPAASTRGNGNGSGGNDNCVEPSGGNGNCAKTFGVIVGHTPTLYPSLVRSLPVTYTNPNSFDISITTYRVSVTVPSSRATVCPATSLQVPVGTVTLSPTLTAPKKGSVSTTIPIKLPADAPAGCQGVTFSITVNASAVKR